MTIQKIKKKIDDGIGKKVNIVFNGSRNKKEYYIFSKYYKIDFIKK